MYKIEGYIQAMTKTSNRSTEFFDTQFHRQIRDGEFALNPFEELVLPYLHGRVLDLACGLGNLTIEAARRGCSVLALDASPNAIERIRRVAAADGLSIEATVADLTLYQLSGDFDAIVSIGLLMFLKGGRALELLSEIQRHVRPGGCAIINVMIEGTTYLEMFEPGHYYLFDHDEIHDSFAGWEILESKYDNREAPGQTVKMFTTVVARKTIS
ncbi:MAG: class I SAM-dependent methyltransferase [Acidobacteriota bacterium]